MYHIRIFGIVFLLAIVFNHIKADKVVVAPSSLNDNIFQQNDILSISSCSFQPNGSWKIGPSSFIESWIKSINPLKKFPKNKDNESDRYLNVTYYLNPRREIYYTAKISNHKSPYTWEKYGRQPQDGWIFGPILVGTGEEQLELHAFIYPDYRTAIVGKFLDGKLLQYGFPAKVAHFRCNHGIMELKIKIKNMNDVFQLEAPTDTFITSDPKLMDPYDRNTVYIADSLLPNAGEGLFAKRDIPPYTLIVNYAGFKITNTRSLLHANQTREEIDEATKNLIEYDENITINLPPEYNNIINYRASLGHKVNHGFEDINSEFDFFTNPRFGIVRCLMSNRFIPKGTEILTHYGYEHPSNHWVPEWYRKASMEYID